jgi:hypothetical protein
MTEASKTHIISKARMAGATLAVAAVAAVAALVAASDAQAQRGPDRRAPTLTLYSGPSGQGDSRTFWQANDNLQSVRFNDAATSLVAEGRWEVCADSGFRSICRVFEGRVDDLGQFRGLISSVRPLDGPYGVGAGGPGWGGPGYGGPGYGGPGYGGPGHGGPGWGGGWGRYDGQSVRGRTSVFFPGRIPVPAFAGQGARSAAEQFCRAQGLSGDVLHVGEGRRGEIEDVLCRR